jgi:hypothetical protein
MKTDFDKSCNFGAIKTEAFEGADAVGQGWVDLAYDKATREGRQRSPIFR